MTEGRWAYIGVQGDQWANVAHNSYGCCARRGTTTRGRGSRAPTRCAASRRSGMPSCMIHFQARARARLSLSRLRLGALSLYAPHGPVHEYIGGALELQRHDDDVKELDPRRDARQHTRDVKDIRPRARPTRCAAHRHVPFAQEHVPRGPPALPLFCSMDTPFSECHAECIDLDDLEGDAQGRALPRREVLRRHVLVRQLIDGVLGVRVAREGAQGEDREEGVARHRLRRRPARGGLADRPELLAGDPTVERLWMHKKLKGAMGDRDVARRHGPAHRITAMYANCTGTTPRTSCPSASRCRPSTTSARRATRARPSSTRTASCTRSPTAISPSGASSYGQLPVAALRRGLRLRAPPPQPARPRRGRVGPTRPPRARARSRSGRDLGGRRHVARRSGEARAHSTRSRSCRGSKAPRTEDGDRRHRGGEMRGDGVPAALARAAQQLELGPRQNDRAASVRRGHLPNGCGFAGAPTRSPRRRSELRRCSGLRARQRHARSSSVARSPRSQSQRRHVDDELPAIGVAHDGGAPRRRGRRRWRARPRRATAPAPRRRGTCRSRPARAA